MTQIFKLDRRSFLSGLGSAFVLIRRSPRLLLPDAPAPRFWFGDRVRVSWICDDELDPVRLGKLLWMEGRVTGLIFDSPEVSLVSSWAYQVDFDNWCELLTPLPESVIESEDCLTPAIH